MIDNWYVMAPKSKAPNLLDIIKVSIRDGRYKTTIHAEARMVERNIILPEVLEVLRSGWHEENKDRYSKKHQNWKYSIKCKTLDERSLRVIIAIDESTQVIVITAIELKK